MSDDKTLPAAVVPLEGFNLIKDFAASRRISASEAMRLICKTSPLLKEFAPDTDLEVAFTVEQWGGHKGRNQRGGED